MFLNDPGTRVRVRLTVGTLLHDYFLGTVSKVNKVNQLGKKTFNLDGPIFMLCSWGVKQKSGCPFFLLELFCFT